MTEQEIINLDLDNIRSRKDIERIVALKKEIAEFKQENNQVWAEYARLLDVAEDCACASTKDEAIELLENYKDSVEITNTLNKIKANAIRSVLDYCQQWSMMNTSGVATEDIYNYADKVEKGELEQGE